eukprot:7118305-Pyramimonas_sp.AAC.1
MRADGVPHAKHSASKALSRCGARDPRVVRQERALMGTPHSLGPVATAPGGEDDVRHWVILCWLFYYSFYFGAFCGLLFA